MPPKKQKMKDIREFFNRKSDSPGSGSSGAGAESPHPGGAGASQTAAGGDTRVKKEHDTEDEHLHRFTVKFNRHDRKVYTVDCDQPRTVLEAIKSSYNKMMKGKDENIVIQLGKKDRKFTVATHFPCTCIKEGECLILSWKSEKIEEATDQQNKVIYPRNMYSVFYIDKEGGVNTKTKELFRSTAVRQFKFLIVYGEKGMTVEEALRRDGRFTDDLGDFFLSANDDPDVVTLCTQRVDNLNEKTFKICLPLNKTANGEKQQESPCASGSSKQTHDSGTVSDVARQRGISLKTVLEQKGISVKTVLEKKDGVNTEEIYELLRKQFPGLLKLLESRFPGDSYQKELDLRKENFGKIQASFSEVHRVRKLLELGKSVCKVVVWGVCEGTGFVLFDNFILTNAHLFKDCIEGRNLKDGIDVFALFNYDDPEPKTNYYYFRGEKTLIDFDGDLDYAIIELNPEGQRSNTKTKNKKTSIPPGLLKKFGPMPPNGEACIIGHPAGGVKKMDPTCIIEKEKRGQAVDEHLRPYRETVFIIHSISQVITNQGIEDIMMGGNKEQVATYNTFMYHGSSGSPVFDGQCRVFGLHTAGYTYGFENMEEHVIECAHPLLTIFECFVSKMKEERSEELLKRVQEEAKGNQYLEKIVEDDEPMDVDEE